MSEIRYAMGPIAINGGTYQPIIAMKNDPSGWYTIFGHMRELIEPPEEGCHSHQIARLLHGLNLFNHLQRPLGPLTHQLSYYQTG